MAEEDTEYMEALSYQPRLRHIATYAPFARSTRLWVPPAVQYRPELLSQLTFPLAIDESQAHLLETILLQLATFCNLAELMAAKNSHMLTPTRGQSHNVIPLAQRVMMPKLWKLEVRHWVAGSEVLLISRLQLPALTHFSVLCSHHPSPSTILDFLSASSARLHSFLLPDSIRASMHPRVTRGS